MAPAIAYGMCAASSRLASATVAWWTFPVFMKKLSAFSSDLSRRCSTPLDSARIPGMYHGLQLSCCGVHRLVHGQSATRHWLGILNQRRVEIEFSDGTGKAVDQDDWPVAEMRGSEVCRCRDRV